jgi:hypothetical protein
MIHLNPLQQIQSSLYLQIQIQLNMKHCILIIHINQLMSIR